MTKREIKRLYKASKLGHSRYWSDRKLYKDKQTFTPAILDKFAALLHNRLLVVVASKNKKPKCTENYNKAKEYALAGPVGKLP